MDTSLIWFPIIIGLVLLGLNITLLLKQASNDFPFVKREENKNQAVVNGGNGIAKFSVEVIVGMLNDANRRLDDLQHSKDECDEDRFKLRLRLQQMEATAKERGWDTKQNTQRINFLASLRRAMTEYISEAEFEAIVFDLGYLIANYNGRHDENIRSFLSDANQRGNEHGSIVDVMKWLKKNRPDIDLNRLK